MYTLLLLLGPGCGAIPGYRFPGAEVTVAPADGIEFGTVRLGVNASVDVTIGNDGTVAATVALAAEPPFTLSAELLTVIPGEPQVVSVRYAPVDYADASGALHVTWSDDVGPATDGPGLEVPITARTDPDSDADGVLAVEAGGADCDDGDAQAYPGAADACYDHVDQDCDATAGVDPDDVDCDGDGVLLAEGDCDDLDDTVHPGAAEASADGIDQDCDGLRDEDDRAYGDLVFTEVHDGGAAPGWVELCNATAGDIPLDGFELSWASGSLALAEWTLEAGGCVAVCERESNDCKLVGEIHVDAGGDTLAVSVAGTPLDTLAIEGSWGWASGDVWSLDPGQLGADLNDLASAWCDTRGSQGAMNPDCP